MKNPKPGQVWYDFENDEIHVVLHVQPSNGKVKQDGGGIVYTFYGEAAVAVQAQSDFQDTSKYLGEFDAGPLLPS